MTGPLHLLDHNADFQTRRIAVAVAGEEIQTLGSGPLSVLSAARLLRRRPRGLIHAWGTQSLIAAALAANHAIIFTPPPEIGRRTALRIRWLAQRRQLTVICPTLSLRTALCQIGMAPDRCLFIPPGVDAAPRPRPVDLRSRLNLADDDIVLLAPGESTRGAQHNICLWSTALLHELDERWKLLIWGRGPLARQVRRMGARLNHPDLLRLAPDFEFQDLLPAADAAIVTARHSAATLPTALCLAAGLPIISTQGEAIDNRLPQKLAQRLMPLHDPSLRRSLAETATAQAARCHGMENFLREHQNAYEILNSEF